MSKPSTITVVITCFSEGKLLYDAMESINQQSQPPLEIILVNDASADVATNQACEELADHPRLRLIQRSQNGGTSIARNDGFSAAQGNIIVPLDGDDLLPPNALEEIQRAFDHDPDLDFVYGSYLREDQLGHLQQIEPGDISLQRMLKAKPFRLSSQWTLIGTTPLRRSTWEAVQGYDPDLGVTDLHDVDFWIRVLAQDCHYRRLQSPLYHWRKYHGSNSRKVTPLAWARIAHKNFDIYQRIGLEYRAHELLLLGSKWQQQRAKSQWHAAELQRCLWKGAIHYSSLMALLLPTYVLRTGANYLQKIR